MQGGLNGRLFVLGSHSPGRAEARSWQQTGWRSRDGGTAPVQGAASILIAGSNEGDAPDVASSKIFPHLWYAKGKFRILRLPRCSGGAFVALPAQSPGFFLVSLSGISRLGNRIASEPANAVPCPYCPDLVGNRIPSKGMRLLMFQPASTRWVRKKMRFTCRASGLTRARRGQRANVSCLSFRPHHVLDRDGGGPRRG
jgi:hypothetical protein